MFSIFVKALFFNFVKRFIDKESVKNLYLKLDLKSLYFKYNRISSLNFILYTLEILHWYVYIIRITKRIPWNARIILFLFLHRKIFVYNKKILSQYTSRVRLCIHAAQSKRKRKTVVCSCDPPCKSLTPVGLRMSARIQATRHRISSWFLILLSRYSNLHKFKDLYSL